MTRRVMQRNPLAEINGPVIESLPIQIEMQIMRQVNSSICFGCHGPECRSKLLIMDPYLDILVVPKEIQAARVVDV